MSNCRGLGKKQTEHKISWNFCCWILFLNTVENTLLEGKSKRSGPARTACEIMWGFSEVLPKRPRALPEQD